MAADLTVLQIARLIADAVLAESPPPPDDQGYETGRDANDALDPPTQAVLRVLHETGSWLSKWESELPAETAEPADDEPTLF